MRDLSAKVFLAFSRGVPHSVHDFLSWLATERQFTPSPRVLDVGTGPGRLYPMFKDLGWTVVGMEPDPEYYPAARDAALTAGMPPTRRGGFGQIALVAVGLAMAVYGIASVTGGWLGTPPWWERQISVEEFIARRYGVELASRPFSYKAAFIERDGREWVSVGVVAVGLGLVAVGAWHRRPRSPVP